jgi:hypothetical protein
MADKLPAEKPEVKAPKAIKFYEVIPYQMNRDDGTGSWSHGQWVKPEEFPDELARLIEIGALVPVQPE